MTLAVIKQKIEVQYGVIECEDVTVTSIKEKPDLHYHINAGIYILEPNVWNMIPPNTRFDMTDLLQLVLETGRKAVGFPIYEYWLDIGQPSDYEKANGDYHLAFGKNK
jgi:NDP-sugar pyrophosphorylase family protein